MLKLWLKNRLERFLLWGPLVSVTEVKRSELPLSRRHLQIIVPHRLNWRLTEATLAAFRRHTTGDFSLTLVVNFDEIPAGWAGLSEPNLTVLRVQFSSLGRILRRFLPPENGSMANALALQTALDAEPGFAWAFAAHSDSAPLGRAWNEEFFRALGNGKVIGNLRDRSRVHAAHVSGALFDQQEFFRRRGTVWPRYHFGEMVHDVGDGITLSLHRGKGFVPVLPNTLQSPDLLEGLAVKHPLLASFAENGTTVTFSEVGVQPIFAHMGRGTPRSLQSADFKHKLPVDRWIEMVSDTFW